MTINIDRRFASVAAVLLVLGALLTFGAYSYGESTRKSDTHVNRLLESGIKAAVSERSKQAEAEQARAVKAAVTNAVKEAKRAQRKADKKIWTKRMRKAVQEAREEGAAAGYSSGNAAGFSAGHSTGVEEGIEQGSDELSCSDDLDVPLPPCNF